MDSEVAFTTKSFTQKNPKNCIVSLKLSPPSSHFQHTENFIQSQEKLHPFIETLIPAIIQPSSSHPILRGRQIAIAQTHLPRGALDDIAQTQAYGVAEPVAQASDTKGRSTC